MISYVDYQKKTLKEDVSPQDQALADLNAQINKLIADLKIAFKGARPTVGEKWGNFKKWFGKAYNTPFNQWSNINKEHFSLTEYAQIKSLFKEMDRSILLEDVDQIDSVLRKFKRGLVSSIQTYFNRLQAIKQQKKADSAPVNIAPDNLKPKPYSNFGRSNQDVFKEPKPVHTKRSNDLAKQYSTFGITNQGYKLPDEDASVKPDDSPENISTDVKPDNSGSDSHYHGTKLSVVNTVSDILEKLGYKTRDIKKILKNLDVTNKRYENENDILKTLGIKEFDFNQEKPDKTKDSSEIDHTVLSVLMHARAELSKDGYTKDEIADMFKSADVYHKKYEDVQDLIKTALKFSKKITADNIKPEFQDKVKSAEPEKTPVPPSKTEEDWFSKPENQKRYPSQYAQHLKDLGKTQEKEEKPAEPEFKMRRATNAGPYDTPTTLTKKEKEREKEIKEPEVSKEEPISSTDNMFGTGKKKLGRPIGRKNKKKEKPESKPSQDDDDLINSYLTPEEKAKIDPDDLLNALGESVIDKKAYNSLNLSEKAIYYKERLRLLSS